MDLWRRPKETVASPGSKLDQISGDYEATGKADRRLTEEAEGGRGFGGIGIL